MICGCSYSGTISILVLFFYLTELSTKKVYHLKCNDSCGLTTLKQHRFNFHAPSCNNVDSALMQRIDFESMLNLGCFNVVRPLGILANQLQPCLYIIWYMYVCLYIAVVYEILYLCILPHLTISFPPYFLQKSIVPENLSHPSAKHVVMILLYLAQTTPNLKPTKLFPKRKKKADQGRLLSMCAKKWKNLMACLLGATLYEAIVL